MTEFDEWEIQNFSCWSAEIHGDCIGFQNIFTLYPRGVGGKGEHLEVKFIYTRVFELSFIGSDGSLICTPRHPDPDSGGREIFLTGPKFEEVVAGIRGNEPLHEDRLTLRWETRKGCRQQARASHTIIEAYSVFFHIKPEVFDLNKSRENPTTHPHVTKDENFIYSFRCFRDGNQFVNVYACKIGSTLEDTKLEFSLTSNADKKVSAQAIIWMLNGENVMEKHEHECILVEGEDHTLPYAVPMKELPGLKTVMRCKVTTGYLIHGSGSRKEHLLSNDFRITRFSKFCELKSMVNTVVSDATRESNSFPRESLLVNASPTLSKEVKCLYKDHDFSDFELRCGTVSFPTHRVILSARSPAFKAILSGDMREASPSHMEIEDLDPHTLGRFLAFLYSGSNGEGLEWEGALRLYYAADKYKVDSLKKECTAVLCANISLVNVCDILSLADKHQDEELRSVAHNFISKNFNAVLESEKWEKFMLTHPLLVAKTVTHFAKDRVQVQITGSSRQLPSFWLSLVYGMILWGVLVKACNWLA